MTFHIRQTTPNDVDTILKLILELATYEKGRDLVKTTPDLLRKNLFEEQHAHALLAHTGTPDAPGEAVGLVLYFFNYSTWTGKPGFYLDDLYVKPKHRHHGIGTALFEEVVNIAKEEGCARVDLSVLKWNRPALNFYEKLGAKATTEWTGLRLTL